MHHLPEHPNDLDIVVVRKQNSSETYREFNVRKSVVLCALQYLIFNNVYFNNISINHENLALLPEYGNITVAQEIMLDSESDTAADSENPSSDDLLRTCVPSICATATEQETINHYLQERASPSMVMWPERGQNPINEFSTEKYFSCAFPGLFSTGAEHFSAARIYKITTGNYFKHFLMYDDDRFANHCRFRYFALNTEMQWCAL